ncbi:Low molecular weight protein-tyrosine-phosphatase YwlE [Pseudobythopirellula maris]|uniref:L-threonylcarbamoyladenylate synthase n=1 Tax=Pseudobythopirellula maris TaxID=2527991 RepID=A0A5C5ZSE2_9BACT|nr:L-threonylcarbamoyladenylate synthase [Pseudobythopirellula maris]TWT90180.1 Low molecular weight protein-tyrosine-phosphatase YwlE [Pseudobythopirellula maris]
MPPRVINVAQADDLRDVVHRTVQALAEGQLVGVPTETVYGIAASADRPDAVARLAEAKGRAASAPFALAVKGADDAEDYAPQWGPLARRLARRCWPGPVTLVVGSDHEGGLTGKLCDGIRQHVCPNGTVGFRAPANRVLQDVLRMHAGPLVLTSANASGDPEATDAKGCVDALGDSLGLVLDDGPARYGQASSVVRVWPDRFEMLREGVVGKPTIERLSSYLVVMVCTGNTCRSPMAEGLMRRKLAERLKVTDDELESRGLLVASAGLSASNGGRAAAETLALLEERGISLAAHSSQMLSDHLIRQADLLLTMTRAHRDAILGHWPEAAPRVKMMMPGGRDVPDPIGGSIEVYRQCAEQLEQGIDHHLDAILKEIRTDATEGPD